MATMSVNSVLMKFFKLPPAVRMMLALLGFGSLAAILFRLLPGLRSKQGMIWMLVIFGVGIVLYLIFWAVRRLFFSRKSSELSDALESQGPTRGDIAEQEQIYREKFRAKLAELKTNGLSVYRLPWFVLLGEPGCGKTASLIHSGLDFPLGKDEVPGFGGTRNYNWWFTNEAVILDTAGRIAFQEEGTTDKVEWEYFLKLLKQHRQRCPINGVIIAIPADRLLRDTSEERAQKAAVLRDRLRQVHQQLGVRFPTFVLVTKMDLVGGFSEFFEEIRVDLQQRNQMFGWSRPGEFQEPYDPDDFPDTFDQVYRRLRNWEMRYLQRKATEDELGLIVTFPEAFRQLREPLGDYVSTIFQKSPLLEPPFFRGFYFTSAVQEGAPIFDVFARAKAGVNLPEQPTRAVDSKAFFIHDFYARKVFPEHGLVFRSAKHVSLNKRMRRLVWFGSAAMVLLMIALFAIGSTGVSKLLTAPREDCKRAAEAVQRGDARFADLPTNLKTAGALWHHYRAYQTPSAALYARLLFIGGDIHVPEAHVGTVHARFTLDCIVRPILTEFERRLDEAPVPPREQPEARKRYLKTLATYTRWYADAVGQVDLAPLDKQEAALRRTQFETLLDFVHLEPDQRKAAATEFEHALATLAGEPRSFAREILTEALHFDASAATRRIASAVAQLADSWIPVTQLSGDQANAMMRYWADFADHFHTLAARYGETLSLAGGFAGDSAYDETVTRFLTLTKGVKYLPDPELDVSAPGSLYEAWHDLRQFLSNNPPPETPEHHILRLAGLRDFFRKQWDAEFDLIYDALHEGAPDEQASPQATVYEALHAGRDELVRAFDKSIAQVREQLRLPEGTDPLKHYADLHLIVIDEANPPPPRQTPAVVRLAPDALGSNNQLVDYLTELRALVARSDQDTRDLADLRRWPDLLKRLASHAPPGRRLQRWFSALQDADPDTILTVARRSSGLKDHPFWQPGQLYHLARNVWEGVQTHRQTQLLDQMEQKARETLQVPQMPGLARLIPGFDTTAKLPFERQEAARPAPVAREPKPATPPPAAEQKKAEPEKKTAPRLGGRRKHRATPKPKPPEQTNQATRLPGRRAAHDNTGPLLRKYHTIKFMIAALRQFEQLRQALAKQPGGQRVIKPLTQAADAYIDAYFLDWFNIYNDPTVLLDGDTRAFLKRCRDGALSWPEFVTTLTRPDDNFATELANRTEIIGREVVFFAADLVEGEPVDDAVYDRINERLDELNRGGKSLPHLLASMLLDRNQPPPGAGDPPVVYAQQIVTAWSNYLKQLRGIGTLTDEAKRPGPPPDLDALAENIVYRQATGPDFPLIAPLLDIAAYGQQLLVHHLEQRLAEGFAPLAGRYPVLSPAAARDDSVLLTHLRQLGTVDPEQFVKLLRMAAEFEHNYGALYQRIKPNSPARQTLQLCQAWARFLYHSPDALLRGERPRPIDVWVAIVRDPSGTVGNAGNVYQRFTVSLPLLTPNGTVAPPIEFATRAGEGIKAGSVQDAIGSRPAPYRWSLFAGRNAAFRPMTVTVSTKHPQARPEYPERADGWRLPGNPWSLLMAIGANPDNDLDNGYWKIPVRIDTRIKQVGFWVGLRIGNRDRPFPGVIPPPAAPGPRPTMTAADKYLAPRR